MLGTVDAEVAAAERHVEEGAARVFTGSSRAEEAAGRTGAGDLNRSGPVEARDQIDQEAENDLLLAFKALGEDCACGVLPGAESCRGRSTRLGQNELGTASVIGTGATLNHPLALKRGNRIGNGRLADVELPGEHPDAPPTPAEAAGGKTEQDLGLGERHAGRLRPQPKLGAKGVAGPLESNDQLAVELLPAIGIARRLRRAPCRPRPRTIYRFVVYHRSPAYGLAQSTVLIVTALNQAWCIASISSSEWP